MRSEGRGKAPAVGRHAIGEDPADLLVALRSFALLARLPLQPRRTALFPVSKPDAPLSGPQRRGVTWLTASPR